MSVTARVSDTAFAVRDKQRGKIGQTKVKRYRAGKAPEWADAAEEDGVIRMSQAASLAESRIDNLEDARADRRRIRQAEIVVSTTIEEKARMRQVKEVEVPPENQLAIRGVAQLFMNTNKVLAVADVGLYSTFSQQEGEDAKEDDADALDERRRRIKERLLEKRRLEDEEEVKEESEEESEYDTDSSEEELNNGGMVMLKPVFVAKSERDTIVRERLEAEERRTLEESRKKLLEERKRETKQIVVEEIRKEQEIQKGLEQEANIEDIDTDDELNRAEEKVAWGAREIARINKEREDREAMLKDKGEIEKVRNMTEEEGREWERKNPKPAARPKKMRRFMQRDFHKGCFFQSQADDGNAAATAGTDEIYTRDFSAPTGEDKMNKAILIKVMQVKGFGRKGRTKWTHLVNEDTTDWNNMWTSGKGQC